MKNLGLIIVIMLLNVTVFAQKKDIREKEVPPVVLQKLLSKYPDAKTRTWKTKNGDYEADFFLGQKKYEAKYEADGSWKKTSMKIKEKDVPQPVAASFKSSDYAKWTLDDVYLVEEPEYKELYVYKATKGKEIMELVYKPGGDLLKAKSKTEK